MNNTLILTSITNSKDELIDPNIKFDNCDYFAFVDKEYKTDIWEQKLVTEFSSIDSYQSRRNAKQYKILSSILFKEYEYIIWVDGNKQLKKEPVDIFNEYGDFDLLLFSHPDRKCLYDEINVVNSCNLDNKNITNEQGNYYRGQNMPSNWGLFEMSSFIKRNSEITRKFDLMWWEQICKFSSRDQISLPFVLWRLGDNINYKILPGYANTRNNKSNEYFSDRCIHLS